MPPELPTQPVSDADCQPHVIITDSESIHFPIGKRLSFAEADRLFKEVEALRHEKHGSTGYWIVPV